MNVVFIVPTGIGAEIGGHSGDATPAAKMIASLCDRLFIHPNVVNASDINEMTPNMLYTEGSILDGFLEGRFGLEEVSANKILVAVNAPVRTEVVNAVSGARATIGADIEIVELSTSITMTAFLEHDKASGHLSGTKEAVEQLEHHDFDVLVVNTPILTADDDVLRYLTQQGGTNIWGGVEAMLSKTMSNALAKPVIHAPIENSTAFRTFDEVVDPRKAAEMVSVCYLHCCLKGAHLAPKISQRQNAHWNRDIDFMISPAGVWGRPHDACLKAGIPIVGVKENSTVLNDKDQALSTVIPAENYLEVAGILSAKKAGVTVESTRRPLNHTTVHESQEPNA